MKKYYYDYLGIAGSGMCLVHCLAMPILFFLQNTFSRDLLKGLDLENIYLDYGFILLSFFAVFSTTGHCNSLTINTSFWVLFFLFAIAILFEDDFKYFHFLGYGASFGLIVTHVVNIKYGKKCQIENSQSPS